jgi:hypothetical protein
MPTDTRVPMHVVKAITDNATQARISAGPSHVSGTADSRCWCAAA